MFFFLFQLIIPNFNGCIRNFRVSSEQALPLLSETNVVQGATACTKYVEPGYYFNRGYIAYQVGEVQAQMFTLQMDFKPLGNGILFQLVGEDNLGISVLGNKVYKIKLTDNSFFK